MELTDALARRRMVRSFTEQPVAAGALQRVLRAATRAPSAGFTQGLDLVVLDTADARSRYWDTTLPAARRGAFPWPGLLVAPVLVVVCAAPAAYVARYAEPDKQASGLGADAAAWAVPFWFVDAGMAAENLLLAAVGEGLGACFFGVFDHEPALKTALGIPPEVRTVGTVALGHEQRDGARPSRSAARARRPVGDVVHVGRW
jgi:nitroreductase